jgi:hypothetical protein
VRVSPEVEFILSVWAREHLWRGCLGGNPLLPRSETPHIYGHGVF